MNQLILILVFMAVLTLNLGLVVSCISLASVNISFSVTLLCYILTICNMPSTFIAIVGLVQAVREFLIERKK